MNYCWITFTVWFCRRRGNAPLTVITEDTMTLGEVEALLENTKHNAFPVVVSRETYFLVGSVLRRDLLLALGTFFFKLIISIHFASVDFIGFVDWPGIQVTPVVSRRMSTTTRWWFSTLDSTPTFPFIRQWNCAGYSISLPLRSPITRPWRRSSTCSESLASDKF